MQAPPISEVRHIYLPEIEKDSLTNGIPVWMLNESLSEYFRFEVVFDGGRMQEDKPMTSKAAALLLKEGSKNILGKDISRIFDAKGATLNVKTTLDHVFISFICLAEYAEGLIEVLSDLCLNASYEEKEVQKYRKRQARKLDIELRKTEVVAYREMTAQVYGAYSPYGYNSTREAYLSLERQNIIDFYEKRIRTGQKHIFLTGNITPGIRKSVEEFFGLDAFKPVTPLKPAEVSVELTTSMHHFDMPQAVQTSVRLFRPLFTKEDADYPEMFLLSVIFGGYFGSRLMKNIREDEGLTYGIYASLDSLRHSGYFYISTETRHENVRRVLQLINDEMMRLVEHPCGEEELLMVKRYIAGQFLRMIDGPLNVMKVYRTLALDGLPNHFYDELLERIWRCTADKLRQIAHSYLKPDQYSLITVGKIISDPSK